MNQQNEARSQPNLLGVLALLACLACAPKSINIVIAQELPPMVVEPSAPGEPPAPAKRDTATDSLPPATIEEALPQDVSASTSEVSSEAELNAILSEEPSAPVEVPQDEPAVAVDEVRTLSVEPGNQLLLPEDRPAWVGAPPDYTTSQHRFSVGSLPTLDAEDADSALDEPLVAAVSNYIEQEVIQQPWTVGQIPIDAEFIRRNLIDNPKGYECELATSQGPMHQKWVIVRVTPEQRELFKQWHREAMQRTRLAPIGVGLISVLALVTFSHLVLHRRHGSNALPLVNQQGVPPLAAKKHSVLRRVFGFVFLLAIPVGMAMLLLFALDRPNASSHESCDHRTTYRNTGSTTPTRTRLARRD